MEDEHSAIVRGTNLAVSKKMSVEIANFIRGRDLDKAKDLMKGVIQLKVAVPIKKHNRDLGHKRGKIAAGRYPVKAAKAMLSLLESGEMNAINKGLDPEVLYVQEIVANKGTGQMRHGRRSGREAKRTHIDITLEEREGKKKAKKEEKKKVKEKKEKKKEEKIVEKKVEEKKETIVKEVEKKDEGEVKK